MIHLAVGQLEIDWGKNHSYHDHSSLFQLNDIAEVPYYYAEEDNKCTKGQNGDNQYHLEKVFKPGMSKPLWQVIDRINLLGHTLNYAKLEFEYLSHLNRFDTNKLSFEHLAEVLANVDVRSLSADYGDGDDCGKYFRRHVFEKLPFEHLIPDPDYVKFNASEGMENLSPYTVLQLLAQNLSARELPVTWQFADLEEGGWGRRGDFCRPIDPASQFLIVTEGSTDANIIKHALKLTAPHMEDFFRFVDMNEGYPFSGTGNLFNFTKGLIGIAVQRDVIILYDNDAEGVYNFNRTRALSLPENMRVLKLPDRSEFIEYRTIGPFGVHTANINGQAAGIECYLDTGTSPVVRWTNYKREIDAYQGEIEGKAGYMRRFFKVENRGECYDFSKIEAIVNLLVSECGAMREAGMNMVMRKQIDEEFFNSDDIER